MENVNLQEIIQGGAVGISVMLIIAICLIIKWTFKMLGNHMNHNTEALTKLTEVIDKNSGFQKENSQALRDLKEIIKYK